MAIEGGCRWGFDPIWTPVEKHKWSEEAHNLQICKPKAIFKHTTPDRIKWIDIKNYQSQVRLQNEPIIAEQISK